MRRGRLSAPPYCPQRNLIYQRLKVDRFMALPCAEEHCQGQLAGIGEQIHLGAESAP